MTGICESKLECGHPITCLVGHYPNNSSNSNSNQDFRLISGSNDGKVRLWNLRTKVCEDMYKCFDSGSVNHIVTLPDNRIVCGSFNSQYLIFWNRESQIDNSEFCKDSLCCKDTVRSFVLSTDNKLTCGMDGGKIEVWH